MGKTQEQVRANQTRMAQESLPGLSVLSVELEALVSDVFGRRIAYEPDIGADVMVLSFVTKQREHLRTVRVLIDAKQHRDAHLIARTMVEGMARLLWAFNQKPDRTDRWFWFGAILDWRQMKKNEENGIVVEPDDRTELKTYVDRYGPNYYRTTVRKAIETAQVAGTVYEIPEDPWRNDWTTTNIESMFVGVDGKRLYESIYRDSSEWVHWGPRTILRAMQLAAWGTTGFTEEDWRVALFALQLGCQSLIQSLEVLDLHFSLGIAGRLDTINRKMVAIQLESLATES